jgi:uncharacterized repeat protein (TIGR03806 family)
MEPNLARTNPSLRTGVGPRTLAVLLGCLAACDEETTAPPTPPLEVTPAPYGEPYDRLSEWHLFEDFQTQTPASDLIPYDVISPLFSDYTTKFRFLYVPPGASITYSATDTWDFPEGSLLVKSFAHPADVRSPFADLTFVETRILVREPEGWVAHTYVYDETASDAERFVAGKAVPKSFIGPDGETIETDYRIPNTNECKNCHKLDDDIMPLGPRTRQLDRDHDFGDGPEGQVDALVAKGLLSETIEPAADRERLVDYHDESADLSLRARSYFDANCSACHRTGGEASTSALLLDFASTDPETQPESHWGICKTPTSAGGANCGLEFDVVPGRSDLSILICRMTTLDAEKRMPPLGSKVVHSEGLELLSAWIDAMPPGDCTP